MIFPASDADLPPIASNLLPQVQTIEKRAPNLRVLAARELRYPVQQQEIMLHIERIYKLGLLEIFVLRAYVELTPAPATEELAGALGLDPTFVNSACNDLASYKGISNANKSIQVTDAGRQALVTGTISVGSALAARYLVQDALLNTADIVRNPLAEFDVTPFPDLGRYIQKDLTQFPTFDPAMVQQQDMQLDLHSSEKKSFVTEIRPDGTPRRRWKRIVVFAVQDTDKKSITIHVNQEGKPLPTIAQWLESLLQQRRLSLPILFGLA